jgi:hypothetical protein
MKITKKVIAGVLIAGFLGTFLVLPQVAEAGGGGWHGGPYHRGSYNPGYFWGGLAVGALTGVVVGSVLAPRVYAAPPVVYQPAPPVVYQPAPVVVYQPAPVCSNYWVNPSWNGYQWVPGYWAQACR